MSSDNKTRILVRLLDGKTLSEVFNSRDKLNAVVSWIQLHINTKEFGIMTNFPKKVFSDEDYKQSLDALHLVPSAVLIVTQLEKWDNLKVYYGEQADDERKKVEEKRRKEEVEKQFLKMEEERLALERVRTQIEDDKAARRQRWPKYAYYFMHSHSVLFINSYSVFSVYIRIRTNHWEMSCKINLEPF